MKKNEKCDIKHKINSVEDQVFSIIKKILIWIYLEPNQEYISVDFGNLG